MTPAEKAKVTSKLPEHPIPPHLPQTKPKPEAQPMAITVTQSSQASKCIPNQSNHSSKSNAALLPHVVPKSAASVESLDYAVTPENPLFHPFAAVDVTSSPVAAEITLKTMPLKLSVNPPKSPQLVTLIKPKGPVTTGALQAILGATSSARTTAWSLDTLWSVKANSSLNSSKKSTPVSKA
jgi:hypothetical protein